MPKPARTSRARKLALSATALVLAVLAAEAALRLAGFRAPGLRPFPTGQIRDFLVPDATRGFTYPPRASATATRNGHSRTFTTNSLGTLGPEVAEDAPQPRILAVGDSFTMGWGLQLEESWPSQLGARWHAAHADQPPPTVVNAGVIGYGVQQMRASAEELLPRVHPQIVVAGIYVWGCDRVVDPYVLVQGYLIRRHEREGVQFQADGLHSSVFHRPWLQRLDHWLAGHFLVGELALRAAARVAGIGGGAGPANTTGEATAKAPKNLDVKLAPYLAEIGKLADYCHGAGCRFVALLIATQGPNGEFDAETQGPLFDATIAYCREHSIAFVDTLSVLRERCGGQPIYCLRDDFHWSAAANAIAADLLLDALAK